MTLPAPRRIQLSRLAALLLSGLVTLANSSRGQAIYPLDDVRPGMHGIGRTVFSGGKIDEFQVEILGTLRNTGPNQAIILARLSGGSLPQTGIAQGMSGSPVYIDGKLVGAVALGFPFAKEPIAGIQPIQAMINGAGPDRAASLGAGPQAASGLFARASSPLGALATPISRSSNEIASPFGSMNHLLTPVSLSGFTSSTVQTFAADFRRLGFEPFEGLSGGIPIGSSGSSGAQLAGVDSANTVVPGSMISVGLLSGDMNITADGTVTMVDGKRIYAFGHRFLDTGTTDLPFAHSEVVAIVPNLNSSFKLTTPRAWVGAILSDRATAVIGEIGRSAHTIPLTIGVHSPATGTHDYHLQLVNDRFLTPFVAQTAIFSVLDSTERTLGSGTVQLQGQVKWVENVPPLKIQDAYISDSGLMQQVSANAVVPLAFVLGAGFQNLHTKSISFQLEALEAKRQLRIAQAWTSTHEVRPGDAMSISVLLQGENGLELTRSIPFTVPPGVPEGPLNFTISDANTLNFPEFAGLAQSSMHTPQSLVEAINSFRSGGAFYVRVWRQEPSFVVSGYQPGEDLTDPPPSVALILADPSNSVTSSAALTASRGSAIAELSLPLSGYVITGAKTLQVDVKE